MELWRGGHSGEGARRHSGVRTHVVCPSVATQTLCRSHTSAAAATLEAMAVHATRCLTAVGSLCNQNIDIQRLGLCLSATNVSFAPRGRCRAGTDDPVVLPSAPSLVVLGAHLFAADRFDPLAAAVRDVGWSSVSLFEASPAIAERLKQNIGRSLSALPNTSARSVRVVNEGVCVGNASARPFYSLPTLRRQPRWASETGSFDRNTVHKHLTLLASMNHMSVAALESAVDNGAQYVFCEPLHALLRRHLAHGPSVLQIDVEGLDCALVASQNWCVTRPRLLLFESVHCTHEDETSALRSLSRDCGDDRRYVHTRFGMNIVAVLLMRTPPAN